MKTELVRGPLDLLILSILRSGPAHGYAIILELAERSGGAFNLGTGTGYSVRQILNAIADETGHTVPHVIKPRRPGDPAYLVADASAARTVLDFTPAHSDLATGFGPPDAQWSIPSLLT